MPAMICITCSTSEDSVEFPSVADYVAHTRTGHRSRPEKILPPSKPVTPSATELKDMENVTKAPVSPVTEQKGTETLLVVKPLQLQYKWTGVHKTCNSEIKTIEIPLGSKVVVVAYCLHCDLHVEQREVPKIVTSLKAP